MKDTQILSLGKWQLVEENKECVLIATINEYQILKKIKGYWKRWGKCYFHLAGIRNNLKRGEVRCEVGLEVATIRMIAIIYWIFTMCLTLCMYHIMSFYVLYGKVIQWNTTQQGFSIMALLLFWSRQCLVSTALCIIECLAASLGSTH